MQTAASNMRRTASEKQDGSAIEQLAGADERIAADFMNVIDSLE